MNEFFSLILSESKKSIKQKYFLFDFLLHSRKFMTAKNPILADSPKFMRAKCKHFANLFPREFVSSGKYLLAKGYAPK